VVAIIDAAEMVRRRLVMMTAMAGEQRTEQLQRLAGELQTLGQALGDPQLDGKVAFFGNALALLAEVFRNPGPELAGWSRSVLGLPPRRLAHHLDALANALFPPGEPERPRPGAAYEPAVLEALLVHHLDRARIARLKSAPLPRRRW
jgi:hypothetical protein